jgi:hypothetical protein
VVLYDVAHGHFGGLYAAPVFSQIASAALQRLEVAPIKTPLGYDTASLLPFGGETNSPAGVAALREASLDREATLDGDGLSSDTTLKDKGDPARADDLAPAYKAATADSVPDFRGESLRGAFAIARAHGVEIETSGAGFVVTQDPSAGTPLGSGTIQLKLAETSSDLPKRTMGRRSMTRSGAARHHDGASSGKHVTAYVAGSGRPALKRVHSRRVR